MTANSFLNSVKKKFGDAPFDGDQYGGGAGESGSGLPRVSDSNFMFATGIECSYPTIQNKTIRRDQLEECGHYKHWKEDLGLVKELGLHVLRYGLPYYSIHQGAGKFDWSFADEAMREIKRLGIIPILDLMHFGVPDWIGDFQNPELPIHFAEYAGAVAARYPWVRFYTPVNEIYVSARASGKDGLWNEQLTTDRGFITAMKNLVAASILGNHQIAKRRHDCIIVQSESAEYMHDICSLQAKENLINKLRFLSFDLLYAHHPDADVYAYLLDNGMTQEEYKWFMAGEPPGYQVMGNDYYGRNEKIKLPDGSTLQAIDVLGWYKITKEYYDRYRKPVMHTETNVFDAGEAPMWLWKQWLNILQIRKEGVPVLGFTWYSLIDQIDWDTELAEKRGRVNECGLYDLNRKPRPVANAYRMLLEHFGQITIVPFAEVLALTSEPARLKMDV